MENKTAGKSNKFRNLFSVTLPDDIFSEEDANAIAEGALGGSNSLFLGTYSKEETNRLCEDFGVFPYLRSVGFTDPQVIFQTGDPFVHRLKITDTSLDKLPNESNFLIYLFVRRKDFHVTDFQKEVSQFAENHHIHTLLTDSTPESKKLSPTAEKDGEELVLQFLKKSLTFKMEMTVIEWMCMQNPLKDFDVETRPQLPGQKHRGLGAGRKVGPMLVHLANIKGRDGLLNFPEYFHNAIIYEMQGFRFINPAFQGYYRTLMDDLDSDMRSKGLSAVSWAIYTGFLFDRETKKSETWEPQEQVYPTSQRMTNVIESEEYKKLVQKFTLKNRYYIDWEQAIFAQKFIVSNPGGKLLIS